MSIALVTFIISLLGMVIIITFKMFVFKDRHVHPWVRVHSVSDRVVHASGSWLKERVEYVKHQGLLKIVSVSYHRVIPFVERYYRRLASWFYKLHRKLWSALEYSKAETKNVSEYLKNISDDAPEKTSEVKDVSL